MALNKKNRLKKKRDFEKVFKKGKVVKDDLFFAKFLKNETGFFRFAFVVSSKVSRKAVVRNKIRRILSEIFMENLKEKEKEIDSLDVAIVVNKKIIGATREDIEKNAKRIFDKIK
ncbi:MAG: ribonuclease P protein component [Candidatus Yanofskybacteria bacterium CG10_big_fil_rev_8_21_14_0_10_37_15]|uniref:Ribonuclease P protein component n=1 Tax=Candidatus Yanofskybacteria bacterium CG10_big_fil_rev_8_21_14_0_10_37_15 TaxID=1975097 RepID=A0A2H0R800_9BACT|nr:MAG: ribonuclease P protein component [Candidatus Yanofskybacteria bacterium CG10_big_fil_rev_8_21_14_0_10_37_15]